MTAPHLWTRTFALYFAARTVALLGDGMLPVAVALAVRGAGHGDTGVGLVLAAWMTPFITLILFGGVFADRFTARRMMIGADLVRVVTQTIVAVALVTGNSPLWLMLVMSAIAGGSAAMFQPGVASMVPMVAVDVQRANGALRVADALAQLLGPALAATLVVLTGPGTVYAINAGTFALSAACLLLLRLPRTPASTATRTARSMRRDLRVGWQEFRSRTWMWSVILIWVCYGVTLFGPLIPLGSGLVTERLGMSAYGWTMSAMGAGTIVGGLVAMRIRPARPLAAGAVALFGFALIPLSIAAAAPLELLLIGHAVGGAAWAFWSVMWATSIQTQVSREVLNRVSAYEVAGSTMGVPIGQAFAGPVAVLVGAQQVLGFSAVVGVAGCFVLLAVPAIRNLRRAAEPALAV
ncbi:MFS family permease [Allocatelliglobosispora scoriae]|uniref:MFS family permease n=1 Tax=Allocatelliglobosispora scoriae TaxID=643052 RepID=A0A841C2F7_9ACTN|nr:MFS transporter [Allocatelliglobosispora scoriae]MBB5873041.1 MFS family permease [Allocatelliglobosispora scoriae]